MTKKIMTLFLTVACVIAMNVPAVAAQFTPSVEAKPAPSVVPQKGSDGSEYSAIIYDKDGKEVTGVPDGSLIVTPVSQADKAADSKIKDRLNKAYSQLQSVSKLSDLDGDLETIIKEVSSGLTLDDLVVRDLFDVSVSGTYANYLNTDGNYLVVRFKLSTDAQSLASVLFSEDGKTWKALPNSYIKRNSDGTVEIILHKEGVLAFLFDAGKLSVDPNGPSSPQTGEPEVTSKTWGMGFVAAGILAAAGIIAVVVIKKRS